MPRFPKNGDDLDRQARRLYDTVMLMSDSGPTRPSRDDYEPEHPVLVACERWRRAIVAQDIAETVSSARSVALLLQGYLQRPAIKSAYQTLTTINSPRSQANLKPLLDIERAVKQSL